MSQKKKNAFLCSHCDYQTNHKTKYQRHQETLKHKIARQGLECCGLIYYEKHKWINHKKSKKHALNRDNNEVTFLQDDILDILEDHSDDIIINDLKMESASSVDSFTSADSPKWKRKRKKIVIKKKRRKQN